MFSEKLIRPIESGLSPGSISRQWLMLALSVGLAVAVALSMLFAGDAVAKKKHHHRTKHFTKTSTVPQSGATLASTATPVQLTGVATPYTFSNTSKIRLITNIKVTLTGSQTNPGDTGLVLGLDGIDTGIPLTGFGIVPTTFTAIGTPANAPQIRAQLRRDNKLVGTVIDRTPGDNTLTIPSTSNTTLQIKGKRNR